MLFATGLLFWWQSSTCRVSRVARCAFLCTYSSNLTVRCLLCFLAFCDRGLPFSTDCTGSSYSPLRQMRRRPDVVRQPFVYGQQSSSHPVLRRHEPGEHTKPPCRCCTSAEWRVVKDVNGPTSQRWIGALATFAVHPGALALLALTKRSDLSCHPYLRRFYLLVPTQSIPSVVLLLPLVTFGGRSTGTLNQY